MLVNFANKIFDEIASHLDKERKNSFFSEIENINLQTFFSTAEANNIDISSNFELIDISR